MKILVTANNVEITQQNTLNKGEYRVHDIQFEFSEEYTDDLVKVALFSQNDSTYKIIINNNECDIPAEVLSNKTPCVIGVYAYKVEGDELVIRYSPSPTNKYILCGSYIPDEDTENSEPITPSELEQFQQIIEDALAEVANVDIDATKEGSTTTVTITNREGETKTVEIEDGENGQDAKINGYNTLTIQGGTNIDFDQVGNVATINNTYTYDDTEIKTDIETIEGDITDINTALETKIDKDVNNLTYYTLTTQTGSKIDLEINSSTYVLVAKLYDKNNNLISTSSNIDLPLETMVVGASYDSTTKEIVLTLKNGQTIRFSVADLVSGLQEEITSENKLNADLVDDSTSTNKFVTSAEKTQISTNTTDISNIKNGTTIDSFGDVESALEDKEDVSNKSQTLDNSTEKYPSNKAVKDSQDIQDSEIAEMQEILSNIPTTTGTGESITLDNTMKCKHVSDELGGNTDQETTTGKNKLFIQDKAETTTNGIKCKVENGVITVSGTATAGTTVNFDSNLDVLNTLVGSSATLTRILLSGTWNIEFDIGDADAHYYWQIQISKTEQTSSQTKTTLNELTMRPHLFIPNGTTVNCSFIVQAESGTSFTSYEKYTGGIPSPNPSFPSPVNVVKGDNEVVVSNKNLFNKDNSNMYLNNISPDNNGLMVTTSTDITSSNFIRTLIIPCRPNAPYTIQKLSSKTFFVYDSSIFPVLNTQTTFLARNDTASKITATTSNNAKYLIVKFYNTWATETVSYENMINSIQIEQNTQATSYVPHAEQVYPINLGSIELAKIGSYQDKLFKAIEGDVVYDSLTSSQKEGLTSGSWYKYGEIGKVVLNGSENWQMGTSSGVRFFWLWIPQTAYSNNNINIGNFCNYYTSIQNNSAYYEASKFTINSSGGISIFDNAENIDDFKTWLSTHNTTVYYVLSTPTFTEITDTTLITQLENWRNSKSYNGQTNISQTNEDKAFVISYTTLKDVYAELDSRLKALEG